jgi:hypothetical protein
MFVLVLLVAVERPTYPSGKRERCRERLGGRGRWRGEKSEGPSGGKEP